MKIESAHGNDVCFESWDSPVMYNEQLWLLTQVYNGRAVHFFFQKNHGSEDIYVLSIPWTSPFRITEEGLGWKYIGNYLNRANPNEKKEKRCSTFKVWNTSFSKKTYNARLITVEERDPEEIFQYLIITEDVWIEFITLDTPKWEFYKNEDLANIVIKYIEHKSEAERY
ncbi:MAG: hypothetical protein HOP07_08695 [Bacteriovoracaceae bacterium]|nr:hypothetical protein [Bacteriovoracaceae bacterium]